MKSLQQRTTPYKQVLANLKEIKAREDARHLVISDGLWKNILILPAVVIKLEFLRSNAKLR